MEIKISNGNIKMGKIPSVSLPSIVTCRQDCICSKKCYAHKIERLRKTVRQAYQHNYNLLTSNPKTFWREIEAVIMMSRFFRFHVSGDIPNIEYLKNMIEIAARNTHCEILCFTKRYNFVNTVLNEGYTLPDNLHLIMSGWQGLEMVNPFNLAEAHVRYKDGSTTAREDAVVCAGNCTKCAIIKGGCWSLKHGQQVVFNEH